MLELTCLSGLVALPCMPIIFVPGLLSCLGGLVVRVPAMVKIPLSAVQFFSLTVLMSDSICLALLEFLHAMSREVTDLSVCTVMAENLVLLWY